MATNSNTHPAIEFLKKLDLSPDSTFNIEHYTDLPKGIPKPKPDPLAGRYANLSMHDVEELLTKLQSYNDKGAGIFVARNQCNGHRSEKNIMRVRGIHADMDDVTSTQLAAVINHLKPSIIVQSSSPNRCQLYWQLAEAEDMSKEEAKSINQCLAQIHGADPAAVDVSRLLRLPGFKHMKYRMKGIKPAVTVNSIGPTYTADEIRNAFQPIKGTAKKKKTAPSANPGGIVNSNHLTENLENVAKTVSAKYPSLWAGDWESVIRSSGEIGYESKSEADLALAGHIARAMRDYEINTDAMAETLVAIFNSSFLGKSDKWQQREDYRMRTVDKALSSLCESSSYADQNELMLESHGDVRNSKAFAQITRGTFIHVTTRDRWLRWDLEQWRLCEKEEHVAKAKEVCGQILTTASQIFSHDSDRGRKLLQDAMAAHSLPRIMAMLKLAVSEPDMSTTDRELDSDPYLLGVKNGLIDLRSGRFLSNKPELLVTRYCNAAYEEDATCPKWSVFLDQIFQGDIETIESVQRLLGCTLLGLGTEEILIICYGHGNNGKSVFNNVVHKVLGGYSITAPPSILIARRKDDNGPRNDLAALAGARYVSINETKSGDRLDEQVVKIIAGREPISARFLHQEFFEFDPTFTPWLRTNHKPIITGEDEGIWRRLVLLAFHRKFKDNEKDPQLEQKLLEERNGILMWMIDGAKLYLKDGIHPSPRMKAEIATYRKDSDLLGEFLIDHTTPGASLRVNQLTLYKEYREWTETCGVRPLSKKSFTQRLAERGYAEGKSGNARFYVGLKLGQSETAIPGTQDGVGGISSVLPIVKDIDSHKEKTGICENPALPAQPATATCEGTE